MVGTTKTRRPQPLNAAVGGLLSARGWRQRAAVGAVFGDWPLIVGPQLASHTRPDGFENGELTVTADSDAWAAQVRLMAPQLIKRLAEELGHGTVTRIRVRGPSAPPKTNRPFPRQVRIHLSISFYQTNRVKTDRKVVRTDREMKKWSEVIGS